MTVVWFGVSVTSPLAGGVTMVISGVSGEQSFSRKPAMTYIRAARPATTGVARRASAGLVS